MEQAAQINRQRRVYSIEEIRAMVNNKQKQAVLDKAIERAFLDVMEREPDVPRPSGVFMRGDWDRGGSEFDRRMAQFAWAIAAVVVIAATAGMIAALLLLRFFLKF